VMQIYHSNNAGLADFTAVFLYSFRDKNTAF
jgi:hypothetical protein